MEKVKVEPKIFEPIEFLSTGLEKKRNQRSNSRLGYESEKGLKNEGTKSGVKLILNKNYEFKA